MPRVRFNLDALDPEDPFEIDAGNQPHLYKHLPTDDTGRSVSVGVSDLLDIYLFGDASYYYANETGPADWMMFGQVPGLVLSVPLAPPNSGDTSKCRPIGIYKPAREDRLRYLRGE
jgi:hypothetical protein